MDMILGIFHCLEHRFQCCGSIYKQFYLVSMDQRVSQKFLLHPEKTSDVLCNYLVSGSEFYDRFRDSRSVNSADSSFLVLLHPILIQAVAYLGQGCTSRKKKPYHQDGRT